MDQVAQEEQSGARLANSPRAGWKTSSSADYVSAESAESVKYNQRCRTREE